MKTTPLRKKSKSFFKTVEDKLWELCRIITFAHHGTNCYTCSQRNLVGRNLHCGHMWAKGSVGALLKYNLDILRPQCYQCNMNYGGKGAVFLEHMTEEIGKKKMKVLTDLKIQDKRGLTKAVDHYLYLIENYKQIIQNEQLN